MVRHVFWCQWNWSKSSTQLQRDTLMIRWSLKSTVWSPKCPGSPSFALNASPLSSAKKKQAKKETTWPTARNHFSFKFLQHCWWRQCSVWDLTPPKWALLSTVCHTCRQMKLCTTCQHDRMSQAGWPWLVHYSSCQIWLGKQALWNLVLGSLLCRRANQSLRDMYTTCQPRTLLHSARCTANKTTSTTN